MPNELPGTAGTNQKGLRQLQDIEALRRFKARYGQLVDGLVARTDAANLEELIGMFTEDVTADFRPTLGMFRGRADLRRMFGSILPESRAWVWHSFHSPDIVIDGDRATGRWTLYALAVGRDRPQGEPTAIYGRYVDEYVRTMEGWKQSSLGFVNETRSR